MVLKSMAIRFAYSTIPHLAKNFVEGLFGRKHAQPTKISTAPRKKSDTRKLTKAQAEYVIAYRSTMKGTWQQHADHFNEEFGLDKSRSYYVRVFNSEVNLEEEQQFI